jgi:predicted lysophospholipase L1 biosynthesis ABC-type transport system permease subunit
MAGWVVNEAFVKTHLAGLDPIGASMAVWMEPTNPQLPIIGVVGDVSEGSVKGHARPTVFFSHCRLPEGTMTVFVRGDHLETLAKPAVAALHAIDPNLPVTKIRTFDSALGDNLARERLNAIVSGAFALSGLLLSALGLYGLLAFLVSERTKEIGIRIALGAHLGRLTRSVIGRGLWLVAIGAAIGVSASLVLLRSFGPLLFGVTPYNWSTYAAVLALLGLVATLAAYLPARRAARVEPLIALRQE